MAFTPNSKVYLLDVPWDNTYSNQLYFSNVDSQMAYFNALTKKHTFTGLSYVRANVVKVPRMTDALWDCNYMMYQNTEYTNKWFFAFITKIEYINEHMSEVTIETDVYQTWLEECNLQKSFVVREHVSVDTIGSNLVDEGLDTGEYVIRKNEYTMKFRDLAFVVGLSDLTHTPTPTESYGCMIGGVYSGLRYFAFHEDNVGAMTDMLNAIIGDQGGDGIVFIFTVPAVFLGEEINKLLPSTLNLQSEVYTFNRTNFDFEGYTPKNNKLYTYPYSLLYASNGEGGNAEFRFEDFADVNECKFNIQGNVAPNPTVMLSPYDYKGKESSNIEYGLKLDGFPLCSWNNDVYAGWLAQNSGMIALSTVGGTVSMVAGAVTANPLMVAGGAIAVAQELAQIQKAKLQPNQAQGNVTNGSFNISVNRKDFYLQHMTIKKEYAKRIDDYFSMFGYKVNTVKIPNVAVRPHWNYVKTIDVNITGAIPFEDMKRLKQMYNDGVTFWKKASEMCNYSLDNSL